MALPTRLRELADKRSCVGQVYAEREQYLLHYCQNLQKAYAFVAEAARSQQLAAEEAWKEAAERYRTEQEEMYQQFDTSRSEWKKELQTSESTLGDVQAQLTEADRAIQSGKTRDADYNWRLQQLQSQYDKAGAELAEAHILGHRDRAALKAARARTSRGSPVCPPRGPT